MHYIIGESFEVPPVVRGQTDPKTLELNRLSREFEDVGSYSIYYITRRPKTNKIQYTFINEHTGLKVYKDFDSATQADELIAKLKGESLPDYEDYYSKLDG